MQTDWHAIEFTKTRGWEARDRTDDELDSFDGLVAWCARRTFVSNVTARSLARRAHARPGQARKACKRARTLRALIYRVLCAASTGRVPGEADLREVNDWVHRYADARRLVRAVSGVRWDWRFADDRLDHLLGPIAWSMAELLVAPEFRRLRLCDGDDCGWLFIDASKARSRRWCNMGDCGNRAKVARFRKRQRLVGS